MLSLRLSTPPAALPVSLDQAKAQLNISPTSQWDDLVTDLIATATSDLDGHAGSLFHCLMPQAWVQYLDYAFPNCDEGAFTLPLGPVRAVTSITYIDTDGATQTVAGSVYELCQGGGAEDAFVRLKWAQTWPDVRRQRRAVSITYEAGYADAQAVPSALKAAILMHVTHLFENRGVTGAAMPELPMAYCHLISKYRRLSV